MIVNQHTKGWEIISHYTHGILAGKIAMHLTNTLRPDHWTEVLTAIVEHDDHLLGFDEKEYLSEIGTPLDFRMKKGSVNDSYEHAVRVYETSLQKSQLVAMLIGRHLEFLYRDKKSAHSDFEKLFKKIRTNRKAQLKKYSWESKKLEATYNIMRFSDRLSLLICQKSIPDDGRKIEINKTIEGKRYFIWKKNENHIVNPWPFEKNSIKLDYEFRLLRQPTFEGNEKLAKCIANAASEIRHIHCNSME